jgi:hypothetical protein
MVQKATCVVLLLKESYGIFAKRIAVLLLLAIEVCK